MHPNEEAVPQHPRFEVQPQELRSPGFVVAQKATTEPNAGYRLRSMQEDPSGGYETQPSCTPQRGSQYRQVPANPLNHLRLKRIT